YLDAASYMTLYNEACRNDGIAERYDAATIYNTAAGTNPYRYPDQKYYNDEYLRKFSNWYGFDGEIRGGNERTHYYLNVGLNHSNGLVKVGDHKNDNTLRFNVRGNVDMTITNWLSAYTNASMVVNDNYAARGDIWGMANGTWANRFAVLLPVSMVDPNNAALQEMIGSATLINGQYLLGGTSSNQSNAIADSYEAGYIKSKTRSFTFDVGLNFDLGSILEGLTFKTSYGIDYRSFYSEGFAEDYAVYEPTWANVNGQDMIVGLNKHGNDTNSTNEYVGESTYYQLMQFRAQFDYKRIFAEKHNFNAMLMGWGFQRTNSADADHSSSSYHKNTNVNAGIELDYNYDHRYYAQFTGALVHSSKLAPGHREAFSPGVTLAWRLGQEDFIRETSASWIDDMKIMASYANLHQDMDISDWYMWSGYNKYKGGWFTWRDGNSGGWTTAPMRADNYDLTFISRNEFRLGLNTSLFNGLVNLNANWFTYDVKGGLTQGTASIVPSFLNQYDASFLSWMNYNNSRYTGFDFTLDLNKKFGEVELGLGFA
ncbi:MAG: SusC/RagA family TonB-linked outer membrane protein, partial [Duncaniella sp.]|nr:SusC/RagA family TonB-linked outer membrane protein [Duncaniella sp.]